jgi:aminoglycoside phosphotransferase (APT) family kinase protein
VTSSIPEARFKAGANGRVAKVRFSDMFAALKLYPQDGRGRLRHEWSVLTNFPEPIRALAPRPIARSAPGDRFEFAVYSWVAGEPLSALTDQVSVRRMLGYLETLHTRSRLTDGAAAETIPQSLLNERSVMHGQYGIGYQIDLVARHADPRADDLRCMFTRLLKESTDAGASPTTASVVCHSDSNPSNFLLSAEGVQAVDWDAGGLGDPVFELAELSSHPILPFLTDREWSAAIAAHYDALPPSWEAWFAHYRKAMLIWWSARLIRQLHERPEHVTEASRERLESMLDHLNDRKSR